VNLIFILVYLPMILQTLFFFLYCIVLYHYCIVCLFSVLFFVFCFLCLLPKRKINLLSYIYIVRQKIAEMIVKVNQGIDESTIQ